MDNKPTIVTAGHGVGGGVKMSPTTPKAVLESTRMAPASRGVDPNGVATNGPPPLKRKRDSISGIMSSPGSVCAGDDEQEDKRARQPGVKRACNECRQQKLRCNVVQDPFAPCGRCVRLGLECKIESNFKRVGKRSRQAEMAGQIERMENLLQQARANGFIHYEDDEIMQSPITPSVHTHTRNPSLMGSEEAVSSLLHLKTGGGQYALPYKYALGPVELTEDEAAALFHQYFSYYHRFLPFLAKQQPPRAYFDQHPLLFWAVVSVGARRWHGNPRLLKALEVPLTRLVWDTIAGLPTSYYVVKGLCLLCTWRLPTSTTANDPTHVLCGTMLKIATSIGLHRPSHVQDFSRDAVNLNADQVHDRVLTWAVCNIVAQTVGTGYGQPASTLYDWTLSARPEDKGPFALSEELDARLRIEMFCDRVSKEMYSNGRDPRGVAGDEHRAMLMRIYKHEFYDLQQEVERIDQANSLIGLHLKAAQLHLRLAGFYDSSETKSYTGDLIALWQATKTFLEEITHDVDGSQDHAVIPYTSNYLQQMLVAGGFSLLRLLGCAFFTPLIDVAAGRALFNRTVAAIRATSVTDNDLQARLAELMVQMWNGHKVGRQSSSESRRNDDAAPPVDDSLELKVRCRHSMSHVYDTIWRWRVEFLDTKRSSLDALSKQATKPESANDSSASSTANLDTSLDQHHQQQQQQQQQHQHNLAMSSSLLSGQLASLAGPVGLGGPSMSGLAGLGGGLLPNGDIDYFDPNHWMLENLVDFSYGAPGFPAIEQHG